MAVPEPERRARIGRIRDIHRALQDLHRQTQPPVAARSIGIWIVSGGLAATGVALSAASGGWSLLLSVAGMVMFMVDMARQVQAAARTREQYRRAQQLEQELLDHLEFIRRFF